MSAIPEFYFYLNLAKLCAALNFNEFVPNLCDMAGGSSQSILILKLYSITVWVKRPRIYGGLKWLIVLYISIISFCKFFLLIVKVPSFRKSASSTSSLSLLQISLIAHSVVLFIKSSAAIKYICYIKYLLLYLKDNIFVIF